ncbi:hypothetical protein O6P43_002240 [Quillaja saponaria]|uniref:Uncharacterized protein n=1 Tax=Quillaja saponaria TaxID=32244 RepID=A0AAD7QC11_QUISA|nr:hypothetical protein O6P43_002240 [Quillaja saponaria]
MNAAAMDLRLSALESRMDMMDARITGLDASLKAMKVSLDLKYASIGTLLLILKENNLELRNNFDARFQAVMDAISSLALKVSPGECSKQQSLVRVREPVLPSPSTSCQNPNLHQPLTLTAEVDKLKIVISPRTPRKETIF